MVWLSIQLRIRCDITESSHIWELMWWKVDTTILIFQVISIYLHENIIAKYVNTFLFKHELKA